MAYLSGRQFIKLRRSFSVIWVAFSLVPFLLAIKRNELAKGESI
jgi:hypothetical protein